MGCVIPTHLHITIIKLTLNPHTMNLHQLWLITRYSFTEIWRNKTFRVAFMVLIPLLIAYQVSFQSDMFNIPVEYTLVLSSFIPTQNAYMFNLLLVFPLATMGFWVHKQKKYNTLEALLVHPQGNDTYSTGFILGIIIAFMIMGSISLALAGLINLFASPTSFRPLIYLFYLVTLILPTIVFIVGITSFLAARCFKNGTVTTFFMLGLPLRGYPLPIHPLPRAIRSSRHPPSLHVFRLHGDSRFTRFLAPSNNFPLAGNRVHHARH